MIRVAMFVINNFTNDARVHREADTLAEKGYLVEVIALKDRDTPAREIINDNYCVSRINLVTRSLPRVPGFQLIKYMEFILRSVIITLRFGAGICHAHDLNALIPAYIASRLLKAFLIYDSHELATGQNTTRCRMWGERTMWYYLEGWLIKRTHLVITVSPEIAAELSSMYGIQRPRVIMNCPPFEDIPRSNLLRERFGLDTEDIIVIYQGVFALNRGLEVLVESFVYLPGKYKLVLLGPEAPFKDSLKNQACELELSGRVLLHPAVPVDEVVRYVASADVGTFLSNPVVKSQRLGLPNKLFECMVAGTPIVVGTICRELVLQLGVGVTCDQNNPESVADAILAITADSEVYRCAQIKAREHSRREYNWQAQGRKLCALYDEMRQRTISGTVA